jgi:archaellum component FlaC
MLRRILGLFMMLIAIVGVILSVAGTYVVWNMIDGLGDAIDTTLELTSDSLDTVADSLLLTKDTVEDVTNSVDTVEETTANLSTTINDTRPLLDQVSAVATEDVPNSIQAVDETLPNVAAIAGSIDDTLRLLSAFQVTQSVVGVDLGFDLGIDYDPEVPFDESINDIGSSLEGVPDQLRALEPFLATTNDNLGIISDNINTLASDLGSINENIENVQPLLDDYLELVYRTSDLVNQTRSGLRAQLQPVKYIIMILFVWIGLTQVAPAYLGWGLLRDSFNDLDEDEVEEAVRSALEEMEKEEEMEATMIEQEEKDEKDED